MEELEDILEKNEELEEKILKSGWIGIKMRRIRKILKEIWGIGRQLWKNWKNRNKNLKDLETLEKLDEKLENLE